MTSSLSHHTIPRTKRSSIDLADNLLSKMNHCHADNAILNSSQSSSLNSESIPSSSLVREMLNVAWIQCERPDCLKWRSISKSVASHLRQANSSWYCDMNEDSRYNECSVPEERYSTIGIRKCRLSIVTSVLPVGSLVLAQMPGYCYWPGLIVTDAYERASVELDCDGDPLMYNVEFLGRKRTHGWVEECYVQLYGHELAKQLVRESQMNKALRSKYRTVYQGQMVSSTLSEANHLQGQSLESRLDSSWFHAGNGRAVATTKMSAFVTHKKKKTNRAGAVCVDNVETSSIGINKSNKRVHLGKHKIEDKKDSTMKKKRPLKDINMNVAEVRCDALPTEDDMGGRSGRSVVAVNEFKKIKKQNENMINVTKHKKMNKPKQLKDLSDKLKTIPVTIVDESLEGEENEKDKLDMEDRDAGSEMCVHVVDESDKDGEVEEVGDIQGKVGDNSNKPVVELINVDNKTKQLLTEANHASDKNQKKSAKMKSTGKSNVRKEFNPVAGQQLPVGSLSEPKKKLGPKKKKVPTATLR